MPQRLRPLHYRILLLHWNGLTHAEIQDALRAAGLPSVSSMTITNVLNSDAGKDIIASMNNHTIDSMKEVTTRVQAIAPALVEEKISLALSSQDEKVRSTNTRELLEMVGHTPLRRMSVERHDPILEKFKDNLSEDALREEIFGPENPNSGPDGKLLN